MTSHQILDSCIVSITAVSTAAAGLVLNESTQSAAINRVELQLLLLPLIGSMVVSGGMIMMNPTLEGRNITIGRGIFALFFGVLSPQLIGMLHPSLETLSVKPLVLVMTGGIIAGLVFVLSKPFTNELYKRAGLIAKREADRLEAKLSPTVKDEQPTKKL